MRAKTRRSRETKRARDNAGQRRGTRNLASDYVRLHLRRARKEDGIFSRSARKNARASSTVQKGDCRGPRTSDGLFNGSMPNYFPLHAERFSTRGGRGMKRPDGRGLRVSTGASHRPALNGLDREDRGGVVVVTLGLAECK